MVYSEDSLLSLISHIHSQSQDFLRTRLSEMGLNELATSHGNILFTLSINPFLTLGELSLKINRDKSTTTALVKKLEKSGLIEIKKDSSDNRRRIISLTKEGCQFTQKTQNLSSELLHTAWSNFSKDEKKQLIELLNKLSENLND